MLQLGRSRIQENPLLDALEGLRTFVARVMKSPTERASETCERHFTETYLISSVMVNTFLTHCHRHVNLHTDITASASWALIKNSCEMWMKHLTQFSKRCEHFSAFHEKWDGKLLCEKCENFPSKRFLSSRPCLSAFKVKLKASLLKALSHFLSLSQGPCVSLASLTLSPSIDASFHFTFHNEKNNCFPVLRLPVSQSTR